MRKTLDSMVAQTVPDAIVIPATALLTGQDGSTQVMQVSADNHAHLKDVKVGIRQGDQIQITEGIDAGDRIVASGAYGLPDNSKIKEEENPQDKSEVKSTETGPHAK